jgi:adenine-specific DNA methylase
LVGNFIFVKFTNKESAMDTVSFSSVVLRGCGIDVHKKVVVATINGSVDVENNFLLTVTDNRVSCMLKLCTINNIETNNEYLCTKKRKWIDYLIDKSSYVISRNDSLKESTQFFATLSMKVQGLINKMGANIAV